MFTGKHQNKADQKQNIRYPDCRDSQPHGQISSATGSNGKKENYSKIIKSLLQLIMSGGLGTMGYGLPGFFSISAIIILLTNFYKTMG